MMVQLLEPQRGADSVPIMALDRDALAEWRERADPAARRWSEACGFDAAPASLCLIPGEDQRLRMVLAGVTANPDPWALAHLPANLPEGDYHLVADWNADAHERVALGWALAAYRFDRYHEQPPPRARLAPAPGVDHARLGEMVAATVLVRDLVNTPAEALGPGELAAAAGELAQRHAAECEVIVGEQLLDHGFPAIHAVGRASSREPRLVELRWGDADAPALTLVGKGVCFDSGGLDLKNASGMRLMKKDMGGAAHALGLAHLVMARALPVRLRVLIPAVDNAVAGNALRPGDVIVARGGTSIEIDNTDAEGRLVLADTLAEASAETPDLIMDFATLTGAARVALGYDLPALFSSDDTLAAGILDAGARCHDPLWRLPLFAPYREFIDSTIADIANGASIPVGGAITAALFLQAFLPEGVQWAHIDLMAWNSRGRPGRPVGGEAMGLRACFAYLERRYQH